MCRHSVSPGTAIPRLVLNGYRLPVPRDRQPITVQFGKFLFCACELLCMTNISRESISFVRHVNFDFVVTNITAKQLWDKFKGYHNVSKTNNIIKISDNNVHPNVIIEFQNDNITITDDDYNTAPFKYTIEAWEDNDYNSAPEYKCEFCHINFEQLAYYISTNYLHFDDWKFSTWDLRARLDIDKMTIENVDKIMLMYFDEKMRK